MVAAASSERVLLFGVAGGSRRRAGQIGGRKSAAAAEGVDWRRRRGKVWATTRCVRVCAVGVDRRVAYVFLGGAGGCEAMQCNAGDLAWAM